MKKDNNKFKIVVFGSLPIATKVVMHLQKEPTIELVGVVVNDKNPHNNDPWPDIPCLYEYCSNNDINIISMEELDKRYAKGELDLGLSCRFGTIIKENVIDLFDKGIINMHGGLLPEFAGLYSSNFSVLYGAKKGGGTLHFIDTGIDTGDILRRCEFDIMDRDTAYTVFQRTQEVLYENLIEIIPLVLGEEIESYTIQSLVDQGYEKRYFSKSSIFKYKEIKIGEMSDEEIVQKVRAFDFPGYEPAYIMVNGEKIYLRTTQ